MNIRLKICATTDGKSVGEEINWNGILLQINGFTFEPHEVINLGNGFWRIRNSNYSLDAQQLED